MAQKQISQQTFDEAVEENITEFGMSREEAVADAVSQFEISGVDLTNIIKDATDPAQHPVIRSLRIVKEWVLLPPPTTTTNTNEPSTFGSGSGGGADDKDSEVYDAFLVLAAECVKNPDNKVIARSHGGVTHLSSAILKAATAAFPVAGSPSPSISSSSSGLEGAGASSSSSTTTTTTTTTSSSAETSMTTTSTSSTTSPPPAAATLTRPYALLKSSLDALRVLCYSYDEARAECQPDVAIAAYRTSKSTRGTSEVDTSPTAPIEVRRAGLLACAVLCTRRDRTKTQLFDLGLSHIVSAILRTEVHEPALVSSACIALARLLTDDDMSVMASNAYAFARTIGKEGMPGLLLKALDVYRGDAVVASEIFAALRSVIVNDEICREIDGLGGIDIITRNLAPFVASAAVSASSSSSSSSTSSSSNSAAANVAFVNMLGNNSTTTSSSDGASAVTMSSSSASNLVMGAGAGVIEEAPEEEEQEDDAASGAADNASDGASDSVGGEKKSYDMSIASGSVGGGGGGGAGGAKGTAATTKAKTGGAGAAGSSSSESSDQRRIRMVRCGFAALRSLANSDPNKIKMGEGTTLGVLLQALETMIGSPSVLDQVIAVLGNLCLRLTDNSARVHAAGGFTLLARAMRTHPGSLSLQRSACLALRNMIVKDKGRVQVAFDEGFEQLLQQTYMRHPAARDVSYACLRDMGVEYAETVIGRAQADRAARAVAAGDIKVK